MEQLTNAKVTADGLDSVISLGLRTLDKPSIVRNCQYDYFITIAFPTKHYYKIKHLKLSTSSRPVFLFDEIKYGECTVTEQYEWIMWILRRNIQFIAEQYDLFFEVTKDGNIHIHGRIKNTPKKTIKEIRTWAHRMFDTPQKYKRFIDIKEYDDAKWSNYDKKTEKTYQTTNYEHFKNI